MILLSIPRRKLNKRIMKKLVSQSDGNEGEKFFMPINAKRWLDKAKRHLSLRTSTTIMVDLAMTCYFAPQTVELTLKAFLVAKEKDFPKFMHCRN